MYSVSTRYEHFLNGITNIRANYGSRVEKAKDEGLDYKSFSHAFRALFEVRELQTTGFIKFPLTYADELKRIKFGERRNIEELSQEIEDLFFEVKGLEAESSFSKYIDADLIKKLKLAMFE